MTALALGRTASGATVSLQLRFANRHGLVTGATGTGKTVTLQRLAEEFSRAGVPVFAADVKGDLSGLAVAGNRSGALADRAAQLLDNWTPEHFPVEFWDIFGRRGTPIKTSVHEIGPELLASMLRLNETQAGTLAIAFRKARDEEDFFLSLDDLRWALNSMLEDRESVCRTYGNVTASSIAAIQRQLLALESQGGEALFGEPRFDISAFLRTVDGKGVVNLLHADDLVAAPKLYATFLLWLLSELFRALPEAGDLAKPKLVFFFDEAHLLFSDAPKLLLQQIERLVRLIRSKGVGVYFVSQSPADVPDTVLAQLGNRIQHALRAYTPKDQRLLRAAAQAFRPNPEIDVPAAITQMGIGEALISLMESDGVPAPVERVRILPPSGQVGPIADAARETLIEHSQLQSTFAEQLSADAATQRFTDRMRKQAGLPPIERVDEDWVEGDFAKFLPDLSEFERPQPNIRRDGVKALTGFAVALAAAWYVGLI